MHTINALVRLDFAHRYNFTDTETTIYLPMNQPRAYDGKIIRSQVLSQQSKAHRTCVHISWDIPHLWYSMAPNAHDNVSGVHLNTNTPTHNVTQNSSYGTTKPE